MLSAGQAAFIRRMTSRGSPKFYLVVIALMLFIGGLIAFPYLPPVRAEREHAVAIARAELDQITPPLGADAGGTYTRIDLERGPQVWRTYGTGLFYQETHDYYADTLAKAGWNQWKAPYVKSYSDLVATYRKQTQGVSLKLALWCFLGRTYDIHIIQPNFWNGEDQPEARY